MSVHIEKDGDVTIVTLDRLAGPDWLAVTQEVLAKVVAWNPAGDTDLPAGLLHGDFLTRAAEAPDAPAVERGGRTVSYGELRGRAHGLAHRLRAQPDAHRNGRVREADDARVGGAG